MNEQELNKKLAEWAGFYSKVLTSKSADFNGIYLDRNGKFQKMPDTYERTLWHDPEIQNTMLRDYWYAKNGLPDFTQSLDACFKWLWRKAIKMLADTEREGCEKLLGLWLEEPGPPLKPLALCLAIEKLIEGGENG